MKSRLATIEDVDLTYSWATDPLVRQNSYSSGSITPAGHHKWFSNKLHDKDALFLIMEAGQVAVGLVRFEAVEDHFVIGITVAPDQRGNGYASKMLKMGLDIYAKKWGLPVYAYIKNDNLASVKAFERAGFLFSEDLTYLGTPSKLYIWK